MEKIVYGIEYEFVCPYCGERYREILWDDRKVSCHDGIMINKEEHIITFECPNCNHSVRSTRKFTMTRIRKAVPVQDEKKKKERA